MICLVLGLMNVNGNIVEYAPAETGSICKHIFRLFLAQCTMKIKIYHKSGNHFSAANPVSNKLQDGTPYTQQNLKGNKTFKATNPLATLYKTANPTSNKP